MLNQIRPALVFIVLMTLLTGILYPLAVTGLGELLFPRQAGGSLIKIDDRVVGSAFIGQSFTSERYFHGRPSANNYDAANSGGTNLGPTSKNLLALVQNETDTLRTNQNARVPVDLATSSGSGLDPHISPASAKFQAPRVAKARNIPEIRVMQLIEAYTRPRLWGLIGEPRVNVLRLNLALDDLASKPR